MSILKFLGLTKKTQTETSPASQTETVREIVKTLDRLEPQKAKYIASFAYLLSRVAHADLDISDEETQKMEKMVMEVGKLPEEQAIVVVQMAKSHTVLFGGTENYLVTREFREMTTLEERWDLIRCLFMVSAADQNISAVEDNEIIQISSELGLERHELAKVRAEFSHYLSVLKDA